MDKLRTTIILSLMLAMFTVVVIACNQPIEDEVASEPTQEQTQATATHKVVPFIAVHEDKDTPETESITEEATEPPVAIGETTPPTEPSTEKYFSVNLPEYVQDVIFAECEKYSISPAIVIALIERESQFDRYAIGDDGRSFGLMQIQPKWHLEKMIQMGCTDLFNPIQNVKVGIAILGELKLQHQDIGLALTAHNSGKANKGLSTYATAVLARANELMEVTR